MADLRDAELPRDVDAVRRLWLHYLTWGNDELEARHGFRLPVTEAIERDVATIDKFRPPDGRLLLALDGEEPIGTACMRRIGPDTCEVKRMWVEPTSRGGGVGRTMLDRLTDAARTVGYTTVRLDSPDFMTAAHALYRSSGFVDIEPYPESEIPSEYRGYWAFMEKRLD